MKDWCTLFPEYWYIFTLVGFKLKRTRVYIGSCCKLHDETCSMRKFYRCLRKLISKTSARLITAGGTLGCYFKYPRKSYKADIENEKNT